MRNLLIGVLIGFLVGGGVVWAATRASLQDGRGREVGTESNPLYIEVVS